MAAASTRLALLALFVFSGSPWCAPQASPPAGALFQTSDRCFACHNNMAAPSGEAAYIASAWRGSMMANSARDPYWQAAVRREVIDHPSARAEIEENCAKCHMPMEHVTASARGQRVRVLAEPDAKRPVLQPSLLAKDGVSCSMCHQIRADALGTPASFSGGFAIGTDKLRGREIFGPFAIDDGRQSIMRSASGFVPTQATHLQQSEMCATCHTLYTEALDPKGAPAGRLPEQMPFLEWRNSEYRASRSCQSCHMPALRGEALISSVLGQPRTEVSRHTFEGGNAFMLRMLDKHREELDVSATAQEMGSAIRRTVEFLGTQTARLRVAATRTSDGTADVVVVVENLTGHKLPTAYPSRRAWVHFTVRDAQGRTVFESGALRADGSIAGNDNDATPGQFEPHYDRIGRGDQVQIYESVMVDAAGAITTGLLSAVRYVKDNRLLPAGFDKTTAVADIAVQGEASADADFTGGSDRVRYIVPLGAAPGPFIISAELRFQAIGYRWARNLAGYAAPEPQRFVAFYGGLSQQSAELVASTSTTLR